MTRVFAAVLFLLSCIVAAAAAPQLPSWFPLNPFFSVNPDQITAEDFGTETYKITNAKGDDYDNVEVKGHHWAASLYPAGPASKWDQWDGEAAWNGLKPLLERQGFKVVYLRHEAGQGVEATLRKNGGAQDIYLALSLTKDDAYGNSVAIVETGASALTVTLTPPARTPEKFGANDNFPYLAPLPGAKLVTTSTDGGPLDVTTAAEQEMHLAGSGTITKMYDGPPGLSNLAFVTAYDQAFRKAGWTVTEKNERAGGGYIHAHYTANGRDIWANLSRESDVRWDIKVADVGTGLRTGLDRNCKVEIYGVNFDFNKATLRPDSEPVLQQVLAIFKSGAFNAEIGGHTDNVGKHDYNMTLSQQRADAMKAWLAGHGIAAARLTTHGYGDTVPLLPNTSDANRARNRRVELKKQGCKQ